MTELRWISVASYGAPVEADLVRVRLEAAGILAVTRANDVTGIFGPGFGGATARGVDVLVPSDAVHAARELLDVDR